MPVLYNLYELQDGFVHNWLVAGPLAESVDQPGSVEEWVRSIYSSQPQIEGQAVEQGPLTEGLFAVGSQKGAWVYYCCREDHLVDLSAEYATPQYVRAWAYTELVSQAAQTAVFNLTTSGPADVWLNGQNVCRAGQPGGTVFNAELAEGANMLLVRLEGVAAPQCTLAFALRALRAETAGISLRIPTLIPSLERRNELEGINENIFLDRDVYAFDQPIFLCWPDGSQKMTYQDARLQTPTGRIYAQAEDVGKPNSKVQLSNASGLIDGPYRAFIMPRGWEYYESQIRMTKELDLYVLGRNKFSSGPYGALEDRRGEALLYASARENNLFAEIAKMALGRWDKLEVKVISQAVEGIEKGLHGSEVQLLGLVGLMHRFAHRPELPRPLMKDIRERILNFACWKEAPVFSHEARQLVFYAAQVIAGQLYPDQIFGGSGFSGQELRQKGEAQAQEWMRAHGRGGFADWNAESVLAEALTALSHLVDAAKTEEIWELGSVLMDKLFFSIALNSYKGVYGPTQGRAQTSALKSGQLQALSGVTRLMWGMGGWNQNVAAVVSLACMRKYELPPVFADIAAGLPDEMLDKEQQSVGESVVNTITYRTPDGMLSSAQDYYPGRPGSREHVWQATFGPQSLVFVTHPGCSSESDAHAPNYWLGNGSLPRVAQWKDTLVALYTLPEDARLGFTHAYFPTYEFDEYVLRGNTAFARKGDGYIALSASQGLALVERGRTAFRELRSEGRNAIWVCQMGRAATDGDFAAFQEKVLAQSMKLDGLQVEFQTLRGELLSFGWEDPLLVNGEVQPLSGFKHFENPFSTAELPCDQMEIRTEEYLLRLDFRDETQ